MEQKIYVIYTIDEWETSAPMGYFTNEEDADKYCDEQNEKQPWYYPEYTYELIENLSNKENNND
jgi:hypothetical protein